ncbi:RidA family protein [Flavobacterium aurantiibacter]|uniref:Reactive intermediate/imine deaminase n=1 Tax=Flavobacterium aurantiibacter TaxID=2023067 RepID=A0A255ZTS6_9FLAO|nr:RidA family protein [Flavobacterium aurantiibacter]OYQ44836.1 reactive intermediate/imine deaminase [Flavobacterium aurantiibacter]
MKKIIYTANAPAPIGPYNQAVQFGNQLYTSGQIAIDPTTGHLKLKSVAEQTEQVMENLRAVLEAAGFQFSDVVKTSIFLTDMNDFATVNSVYEKYFDESIAPARETVAVQGLPKGVDVEISMIAFKE